MRRMRVELRERKTGSGSRMRVLEGLERESRRTRAGLVAFRIPEGHILLGHGLGGGKEAIYDFCGSQLVWMAENHVLKVTFFPPL